MISRSTNQPICRMTLTRDVVRVILDFMILPVYQYTVKRDFYAQLKVTTPHRIICMALTLSNKGYTMGSTDDPISVLDIWRESWAGRITSPGMVGILLNRIFKTCNNRPYLYAELADRHMKNFIPNNMFNWYRNLNVGDVCNIFSYKCRHRNISSFGQYEDGITIQGYVISIDTVNDITKIGLFDFDILPDEDDEDASLIMIIPEIVAYIEVTSESDYLPLKVTFPNNHIKLLRDEGVPEPYTDRFVVYK
jgi:hypothetical protein